MKRLKRANEEIWIAHLTNGGGDSYYFAFRDKPEQDKVLKLWAKIEHMPFPEAVECDYCLTVEKIALV